MKPRTYEVLRRCIEVGTLVGINQAHKHTDQPDRELLHDKITEAILLEIDTWFTFSEDEVVE